MSGDAPHLTMQGFPRARWFIEEIEMEIALQRPKHLKTTHIAYLLTLLILLALIAVQILPTLHKVGLGDWIFLTSSEADTEVFF